MAALPGLKTMPALQPPRCKRIADFLLEILPEILLKPAAGKIGRPQPVWASARAKKQEIP